MKEGWRCDSPDHNEGEFCSNPECFKSKNPPKAWEEFDAEVMAEWKRLTSTKSALDT